MIIWTEDMIIRGLNSGVAAIVEEAKRQRDLLEREFYDGIERSAVRKW